MSAATAEIRELLTHAGAERTHASAMAHLSKASQLVDALARDGVSCELLLLQADVLSTMAVEEHHAKRRGDLWRRTMKILQGAWRQFETSEAADRLAIAAVDCYQDTLSDVAADDRNKFLTAAKSAVEKALHSVDSDMTKATLLARKSSVMRHTAMYALANDARKRIFDACVRCTDLARKLSENHGVLVEAGQANWAFARYEQDDERYAERLRIAERLLSDRILSNDLFARLTLARFYRLNFLPYAACYAFPVDLGTTTQVRKCLRDSYVIGEAAVQLQHANYPPEIVRQTLEKARGIMEAAVAAGYTTARIVVSLAFVSALLDGVPSGHSVLASMFGSASVDPWQRARDIMTADFKGNWVAEGFALGIDQSEVWSSLGSYARRILSDDELGEALYRVALRLNERNPVALTNLARVLIGRGSLVEARRLIDRAKSFSDRRFFWWRLVEAELQAREGTEAAERAVPKLRTTKATTIADIRTQYRAIRGLEDLAERGRQLETLMYELATLSFGSAHSAYRLPRPDGQSPGLDGHFPHLGEHYRLECKWRSEPATPNDLILFVEKLDTASGLFLSMAGFTEPAIAKAREIARSKKLILMDGGEADLVFTGKIGLAAVVTQKMAYIGYRSEPYFKITPQLFS